MPNNVYYFNPTCELAVANGSFSYMAPRLLREFERDCSALPFVFGTLSDFVLTENKPSREFIHRLSAAGFEIPEFCSLEELQSPTNSSLDAIYPWGWSPAAHFLLKDLKEKCSPSFQQSPAFSWTDNHIALFERITSLGFLRKLLEENTADFFVELPLTGIPVSGMEAIETLLAKTHPLVLKAPVSSSGRGIQILRKPTLNSSNRQWISGILNQQSYLIAEPFLNKLVDLSFQFTIDRKGEPQYLGYSVFETNTNGQYKSSLIHPELGISGFAALKGNIESIIEITATRLCKALKQSIYSQLHRGFLGIDAILYQGMEGIKIQPCIEINSRMNMGILTLQIEKKTHSESTGRFELFVGTRGEYLQFATYQTNQHPVKMKNGKLASGFLPLIEPTSEKQFGAYIFLETAL